MSVDPASLPTLPSEQDQNFASIREGGILYVDKTRFIQRMLSVRDHVFFCARPRRFGKTLMVSTLEAFFQGKKSLFKGLDIEAYMESDAFSEYPFLSFGMNVIPTKYGFDGVTQGLFELVELIAEDNGLCMRGPNPISAFTNLLKDMYKKKGTMALLIDEYDSQLVNTLHNDALHNDIRELFKDFYNVIKYFDSRNYFKFIFITGISKFSKLGIFSAMNYVTDISFGDGYGAMFGYTDEELYNYFNDYINITAENMSVTPESLKTKLHNYYDGYFFGDSDNVYNPVSINKFFKMGEFKKYWIETGSQEFVERYISGKRIDVEALDGIKVRIDQITEPGEIARTLAPEFFLYQAGYLTVRVNTVDKNNIPVTGVGQNVKAQYFLAYPNYEVRSAMYELVMKNYFTSKGKMYEKIDEFFDLLDREEYAKAFLLFNEIYETIPHDDTNVVKRYKEGQRYYRGPIIGFLYASSSLIIPECPSVLGESDLVFDYKDHWYVIELKTALGEKNSISELVRAMDQIYGKKYGARFPNPVRIGIVIDEEERIITHICIETEVYHIKDKKLHRMCTLQELKATMPTLGTIKQDSTENAG
jgi:hypothetical protein